MGNPSQLLNDLPFHPHPAPIRDLANPLTEMELRKHGH